MLQQSNLSVQLQPRDIALLRDLFESRLMTLAHVAAIHFDGSVEAAKKRTQKLRAANLLAERPRRLYQPTILHLTGRAQRLLAHQGHLLAYPRHVQVNLHKRISVSELTLRHELDVLDIKAAFASALRLHRSLNLIDFSTWPALHQFHVTPPGRRRTLVRADGLIRIHETVDEERFEHVFFLERDRSSESQNILVHRAVCYREFYKRGGLAVWNGKSAEEFESHPFRVLMVLQNDERRNNTAERLLECSPPILSQVWLTTYNELTQNPLAPIWITPRTYRDAVAQTEFASKPHSDSRIYRRWQEREQHVERCIVKAALFSHNLAGTARV